MAHQDYTEIDIPVSQVEVGMQVVGLDIPWEASDFLIQGFVVSDEYEIMRLKQQCRFVRIQVQGDRQSDEPRAADVASDSPLENEPFERRQRIKSDLNARIVKSRPGPRTFAEIIPESLITFDSARKIAAKVMESIKVGRTLNVRECRVAVEQVVETVLHNPDALRFLTQIKDINHYTAEHSMNCCVIAATFGRYLGLSVEEIQKLAMGALLQDVGKARIPSAILNKKGKLDHDEAAVMANHAKIGYQLLKKIPLDGPMLAEIAASHHERVDGHGYPRHLHGGAINTFSKIAALADCYDAMTSPRSYARVFTTSEALEVIRTNAGTQFDRSLALEFVKCIGEYPPGSLVEMSSGEVGIVLSSTDEYGLFPKVLLVRDEFNQPLTNNRICDTKARDLDKNNNPYRVIGEVPNGAFGVNMTTHLKSVSLNVGFG
jgi:HD-GYP domain-containing protein (c-di-GMP phosphodiesterase class II)